jgi:EmrB/QacA subfamily drug resistance transporter
VVTLFEEGPERSKALGVWAAVAGSGTVVGVILGGVLTSSLSWHWVLFINVPVTLGSAALAPFLLRESRASTSDHSVDYVGAALVTAGLVAVLYALVNAGTVGWISGETIGLLALGAVLLVAFVWVEGKVRSPLVPLRIFRIGHVRGANVAMLLMAAAMVGLFFVLSLYLQDVKGYSAIRAGMASVPIGLVLITLAGLGGPLAERLGVKRILLIGLATFTVGIAWLSQISVHGSYLAAVFGPSILIGAGLALAFVALTIASVQGIEADHSGVAGGLITMTQQVGGSIGLAIISAVITSHTHGHVPSLANFNGGLREGLRVAAAMGAASVAVAAVVLPRDGRPVPRPHGPTLVATAAVLPTTRASES